MYNFISARIRAGVTGGIVVLGVTFLAAEPPREARAAEPPREARAAKLREILIWLAPNLHTDPPQKYYSTRLLIPPATQATAIKKYVWTNNLPLGFDRLCFQK